jgi:hypothetical protein
LLDRAKTLTKRIANESLTFGRSCPRVRIAFQFLGLRDEQWLHERNRPDCIS